MNEEQIRRQRPFSGWRWSNRRAAKFGTTLAVCIAIVSYLILKGAELEDTAALYVGLPILLALTLSLTAPSRSAITSSIKAMAIFLLLSAPILKEGFICIIMASPIFFAVAATIGALIDWYRVARERRSGAALKSPLAITFIALLALEGTHDSLTVERFNEVTQTRIVALSSPAVVAALARPASFDARIPFLARLFPRPIRSWGSGLEVGDTRSAEFLYYKHVFASPHRGVTEFTIVERGDNFLNFEMTHDTSYVGNYLTWRYSRVQWRPMGPDRSEVTWTLGYERKLDPAWYFQPLQSLYVNLTARTMIENLAMERDF